MRSCNYHIWALRHIRSRLTSDAGKIADCNTIDLRELNYCNSLFYDMSDSDFTMLQGVQNKLARVVCRSPWSACMPDLYRSLHWLPVKQRLAHPTKSRPWLNEHINGIPTTYISSEINTYHTSRSLRSALLHLLQQPLMRISFERAAFRIAPP